MFTGTTEVYDKISEFYPFFIAIITSGSVMRIIYCCIRIMGADESEQVMYKKRIKNCIVFFAIAMSAYGIAALFMGYANP